MPYDNFLFMYFINSILNWCTSQQTHWLDIVTGNPAPGLIFVGTLTG